MINLIEQITKLLEASSHTTALGMLVVVLLVLFLTCLHFVPKKDKRMRDKVVFAIFCVGIVIMFMVYSGTNSLGIPTLVGDCNAVAYGSGNEVSNSCIKDDITDSTQGQK